MKNRAYLTLPIMILVLCFVSLMWIFGSTENISSDTSSGTSGVTNNITNNVVEYESIKVEDLQTAVNQVVKKVEDAVVGVTYKLVEKINLGNPGSEVTVSLGSGVIYKREEIKENGKLVNYKYYVLTNRHVVYDEDISANEEAVIYVYFGKEDIEIKATIVGYDLKVDIAVITFESTKYIQPVEIADSNELERGDFVIAMGHPDGYDYYGSATFGIVSGEKRYLSNDTDGDGVDDFYSLYIQHDVAVNPGNSGGGLFNLYGELVGINYLKIVSYNIEGMGFAIPSNVVKLLVEEYIEPGREIKRARLGVLGIEVRSLTDYSIENSNGEILPIPNIYGDEARYGIYVTDIYKNTTLYGSGIETHDIILSVGGIKATRTYAINAALNSLVDFQVGDVVEIEYYSRSENKIKTITVTLKG